MHSAAFLLAPIETEKGQKTMLFYLFGELYYSVPLVWLSSAVLLAAVPGGILAWHASSSLPAEWLPVASMALNHACAATLLSGSLYWIIPYNLDPGFCVAAGQPELFALRAVSALVASCAAISLVALLPQPVLYLGTVTYVGLSINLSCWWSSLWLHLQSGGLASLLPPSLLHVLAHERPIDFLRRNMLSELLSTCRQVSHSEASNPAVAALAPRPTLARLSRSTRSSPTTV